MSAYEYVFPGVGSGLTKRELFAAAALAGLCANQLVANKASDKAYVEKLNDIEAGVYFAEIAVAIADATLALIARTKPE